MFRILFHEPRIAGNTGAAIRLAAVTGAELHLVEPLGFDMEESKLRRAGLDYHDLAVVTVHADLDAAMGALLPANVYAFTASGAGLYTDVAYQPGDVLLFGAEPTGLPASVLDDPRVTARVRLPMLPGRRSMNLANTASVAVFEAWRQQGFTLPD
ncbi:tRNA (uridine(34)/cytosine(34)/5-carboxymethylaminomethyluridine(34)-2'-O)-methyltransferase TrmL [Aeromicrobium sp. A1-2]|uniref:tRNA (cytidine(34)-2'-O)-methyltransferase n=1 Tax=Aeromicrobium sp. A1-2 TaxID=2107713 RepID=UPI000E5307EB|nr:tRNA (cytidine(34)-2'-O)-methyltransferase [Aeromicrobium sp. A1-2]AXT86868.1 tRNA (uridine(34)/cytosine(34)/5-carboxymethylaminomethyluridine(34)-2'-O)-methyltransferase TrmL [Aeromicrobium sp. A1-2]